MRVLSARARNIRHDRLTGRVSATIILHIQAPHGEELASVRTSAPVHAPGAAPLKERLVASAKLLLAMDGRRHAPPEAATIRPAA